LANPNHIRAAYNRAGFLEGDDGMLEQNKHIARQFIAAFAAADTRTLERIVSEHMVDHNLAPGQKPGRRGVLDAVEMFRVAFPDLKITIESLVADEERVSVTGKMSGTNQGTLMGAPATGKTASFAYMDMYAIAHGQIVETWHVEDLAGMMRQLGLLPAS
jgi:steroid delta-isomerase-like uncharacterized protein